MTAQNHPDPTVSAAAISFTVYCDGACSGNPGPGGWGALIMTDNHQLLTEISGHHDYTTNNRMEMQAAIESLKLIPTLPSYTAATAASPIIPPIAVFTDSTYLKEGITNWIIGWKKSNWKNGKVKNIDLWQELDQLNSTTRASWHWVRGHSGCPYNERADFLATSGIKRI